MTTTYITTEKPPSMQTTYITNVPQTTYIEVYNDPRTQRNRWANKQKSHSATAGLLLFAYGGMDMAQGLGWNQGTYILSTLEFQYSWFIGVIIGAVAAAFSLTLVPKWAYYTLGGVMQLIDAIICVSAPYNYNAMVAARYVGGVGIGLITVAFIIHSSEITTKDSRASWVGLEQNGLALGIAIQVIMNSQWDTDAITFNQAHGIYGIVFSLVAVAIVVKSVESPIFYLRKNNEEKARKCQWQLMSNMASADACNKALDEAKRYVAEGNSLSIGAELSSSLMPFIKLLFCRCLVAFSFSLPLSQSMQASTILSEGYLNWTVIVWAVLRWAGTFFSIAVVDRLGRKFVSMLGLLCMAGLVLGLAGIYSGLIFGNFSWYDMYNVCRINMAFQFFAGLYVSCTTTYLSEAFPMRVKPFFIALIVCIEQVIHIVVIVTFQDSFESFYEYFLAVGIILVVSLIIFGVLMPETRGLTLRKAGERFRRVHDFRSY